jgi:adenosylmethionine-8-amino-7-oxononanoate aminotransferase
MGSYVAGTDPLVIVSGSGSRLLDADGCSYIDANSSWWACTLGHNHPRLVAALRSQSEALCHCSLAGTTHPNAARLADALCAIAPSGLERVFFSDNGSTAVEVAVKLCVQHAHQNGAPRRTKFVSLENAFHGETVGAASLGGVEVFRTPFAGILFDTIRVPSPADAGAYEQAFEALGKAVGGASDEIAAVVLEPCVQGAAGMRIYPPGFVRQAREVCTRHEIPLVLDEVFTGYGRTGPMFACELAGISPDVLCLAKGFSGGVLPMAATLTTERLFAGFLGDTSRALAYGHTYCGNPLGAAVALEVLAVYEQEQILERARPKAQRIAETFAALEQDMPGVARARSLGMIGALELPGPGPSGYLAKTGWRVFDEARKLGVYLRPLGDVVYVAPPLNIPDGDLETLLACVREALKIALEG